MLFSSKDRKALFFIVEKLNELNKIVQENNSTINGINDSIATFHKKLNDLKNGEPKKEKKKQMDKNDGQKDQESKKSFR